MSDDKSFETFLKYFNRYATHFKQKKIREQIGNLLHAKNNFLQKQ